MNYLVVNDVSDIYNSVEDYFYMKTDYLGQKLVIDLPVSFIDNDLYNKFVKFLSNNCSFHIVYKGVVNNNDFGIPVSNSRLVIVCGSSANSGFKSRMSELCINHNVDSIHNVCSPLALLYGKFDVFRLYKSWCDKLGFPSDFAKNSYDEYLDSFNGNFPCVSFVNSVCSLYSNPKPKFDDGSNDLPKGKPLNTDDISVSDRISMLGVIPFDSEYLHFNPRRVFCNNREILRLNGFADDFSFSGSREECLDLVHSRLSPYVVNCLYDCIFQVVCLSRNFKLFNLASNHSSSDSSISKTGKLVVYNVPKSVTDGLASLGSLLGLNNRSRLCNFLFKYFVASYDFLLRGDSCLYCFIDYRTRSGVVDEVLMLSRKFDEVEVLSLKCRGGGVYRLVVCFDGDVNGLNGYAKGVVECGGVLRVRFVGFQFFYFFLFFTETFIYYGSYILYYINIKRCFYV